MRLHFPEWVVLNIILTLSMINFALIYWNNVTVDYAGYASAFSIGLVAFAIGQYYRIYREDERIAMATIAAALFIFFSTLGSAFNYLLLPVAGERIDLLLMRADAWLGYDWAKFATVVAENSFISGFLKAIYLSVMPQMIAVIVTLGFSNRCEELHHFLLTGVVAALITILFWAVFPSTGPASFAVLSPEIANSTQLVVGPLYGAELNRLMSEGVTHLSPNDSLGLIAFPSFHTVMALLSVTFMVSFRRVWPLVVVANIFMVPAILAHGGHHLVDLLGGVAVFGFSFWFAKWALVPRANGVNAHVVSSPHRG